MGALAALSVRARGCALTIIEIRATDRLRDFTKKPVKQPISSLSGLHRRARKSRSRMQMPGGPWARTMRVAVRATGRRVRRDRASPTRDANILSLLRLP